MYTGKTLFAQIMDYLPWKTFNRIVSRYDGDHRVRTLPCAEHFRTLACAQLTYRKSLHDVNVLDLMILEPAAIYIMDRAYLDFDRLFTLHDAGAFFVTRAKVNSKLRRIYSAPSDRAQGITCDQTVALSVYVLVAIVKKRLNLDASLYTLLQVFSVTLFEKIPLNKDLFNVKHILEDDMNANQLNLFNN